MQRIGEVLANKQQPADFTSPMKTKNLKSEEQSSNSRNVNRRKVIELMFTKFAVAFRGLWHKDLQEERYQEFAKKEWEKHLREFSDAIIITATEICEKKFEMPPTMAQFIGLCKNELNRQYVNKQEPIKKSKPEVAIFHLSKMKEILNNRR